MIYHSIKLLGSSLEVQTGHISFWEAKYNFLQVTEMNNMRSSSSIILWFKPPLSFNKTNEIRLYKNFICLFSLVVIFRKKKQSHHWNQTTRKNIVDHPIFLSHSIFFFPMSKILSYVSTTEIHILQKGISLIITRNSCILVVFYSNSG